MGIKVEHALRMTDLSGGQVLLMSLLAKHGMKLTSRKLLFRPSRSPLLKSNTYMLVFLIRGFMLVSKVIMK